MSKATYEEVQCKSVLHPVKGMPFQWSINPYKGCVHSCHYCFARRFHAFIDLNADEDFTSIIMVKANAPAVLRAELAMGRARGESIALGTATDPYQPIEGKYRLTRAMLQALADHRASVGLVTKGTMIVRDIDLLAELSHRGNCTVSLSITTLDEGIWERLEPGTPPPRSRLRALERLTREGINAGVALAPVVPGITDSPESLEEVARGAVSAGARFLEGRPLYLMPGVKEHFQKYLAAEHPELRWRYEGLYPGAYPPRAYSGHIDEVLEDLRERFGLHRRAEVTASPLDDGPRQLAMAL